MSIDVELSIKELRQFCENNTNDDVQVDFYGGEPLIHFNKIKQILDGVRDIPQLKKMILTNGLLLTQDIVDYVIENHIQVSVSFDGLWQDKNRLQLS